MNPKICNCPFGNPNIAIADNCPIHKKEQSNSVVSIEDAAVKYAERQTKHFLPANDKVAFKEGAKFRDEQYNSLLNSYRELLESFIDDGRDIIREYIMNDVKPVYYDPICKHVEKADKLLSQFKQ